MNPSPQLKIEDREGKWDELLADSEENKEESHVHRSGKEPIGDEDHNDSSNYRYYNLPTARSIAVDVQTKNNRYNYCRYCQRVRKYFTVT